MKRNHYHATLSVVFATVLVLSLLFASVCPVFATDGTVGDYSVWFVAPAGFDSEVMALEAELSAKEGEPQADEDAVDAALRIHTKAVAEVCAKYNAEYLETLEPLADEISYVSAYTLNVSVRATPSGAEEMEKLDFVQSVVLVDSGLALTDAGVVRRAGDIDSDGEVTAADARTSMRFAVDLERPADLFDRAAADYDGDGSLTAGDARSILRVAVGLAP